MWPAYMVFLLVLSEAAREEAEEEAEERSFEGHTHGLELEHDLSLSWKLEKGDEAKLQEIVKKLNPTKKDITWKWEDERSSWTFGGVNWMNGTAKETLALHMLHRHGLAPLISAHSAEFAGHYKEQVAETLRKGDIASCCCKKSAECEGEQKMSLMSEGEHYCCKARVGKSCDRIGGYPEHLEKLVTSSLTTCPRLPPGLLDLNGFIAAEESLREVLELQGLLHSLSLSGLRNLHSFDHRWSVREGAEKYYDCSKSNNAGCPLQASFSAMTLSFMRNHAFNEEAMSSAATSRRMWAAKFIVNMFNPVGSGVSFDFFNNFMGACHTGWKKGQDLRVASGIILGRIRWEGGCYSKLEVPILKSEEKTLVGLSDSQQEEKLMKLVEAWMERKFAWHKRWAEANRLKMWAFEEAEFFKSSEQANKR